MILMVDGPRRINEILKEFEPDNRILVVGFFLLKMKNTNILTLCLFFNDILLNCLYKI